MKTSSPTSPITSSSKPSTSSRPIRRTTCSLPTQSTSRSRKGRRFRWLSFGGAFASSMRRARAQIRSSCITVLLTTRSLQRTCSSRQGTIKGSWSFWWITSGTRSTPWMIWKPLRPCSWCLTCVWGGTTFGNRISRCFFRRTCWCGTFSIQMWALKWVLRVAPW